MHEVGAVATAYVAPTEYLRERVAVPEDVELFVEEQGELTLLATHRVQGPPCLLHPSASVFRRDDLSHSLLRPCKANGVATDRLGWDDIFTIDTRDGFETMENRVDRVVNHIADVHPVAVAGHSIVGGESAAPACSIDPRIDRRKTRSLQAAASASARHVTVTVQHPVGIVSSCPAWTRKSVPSCPTGRSRTSTPPGVGGCRSTMPRMCAMRWSVSVK